MLLASRRELVRYGLALLSVVVALLLQQQWEAGLRPFGARFILMLLPVTLSAWFGGRGPGFVATVFAAIAGDYLFREPSLDPTFAEPDRDIAVFLFVTEGLLISLLAGMLHQSERRNIAIRRTATDGVVTANQAGTIVDVNTAAEQLFGYHRNDLLGKSWGDLLIPRGEQPGNPAAVWRTVRGHLQAGNPQRQEMTALLADGTTFPVDLSLTILPQNDGPPLIAGFVRDTRPSKHLEQQLNRQTQITRLLQQANALLSTTKSFESVMQSCLDMVCEITGWPVGRIYLPDPKQRELVSTRICSRHQASNLIEDQRLRFRRGEGLAGRIWETGEPEWVDRVDSLTAAAAPAPEAFTELRGAFGFPVKVHEEVVAVMEFWTADQLPPSEEILLLLGSVGEQLGQVIERRRREEQLRKARDAAEAANRAKSEFLANVSHEVRTPMNAVLGVLQIVLGEELTPPVRDHLLTAADSARTLMALLNDLLDFSRMEAGRFELESLPFNLRESLHGTLKSLAFKAEEKRLRLGSQVAPDVPDQLVGDSRRIRQVLLNLIGNAIKFTNEGEVMITVTCAQPAERMLSEEPGPAPGRLEVQFTVADTGIGIHPEDQRRIFEPFTQVDGSFTRRHAGTGLGLTICSELVRRMGGRMWLDSEVGKGSQFHCVFPLGVQATQKPIDNRPFPTTGGLDRVRCRPLRVLLAEDTPANQKVVSAILAKRGHLVEIAQDGRETIDKVREGEYDVVLMDVQMPNVDGYQATRTIRQFPKKQHACIPIVAMTAHAMSGDREQCLAAGMDDYVPKPIDAMELINVVERAAGSECGKDDDSSQTTLGS